MFAESRDRHALQELSVRPNVFRRSRLGLRRRLCTFLQCRFLSHNPGIAINVLWASRCCIFRLFAGAWNQLEVLEATVLLLCWVRPAPRFNGKADESRDFGRLV